MSAATLPSKVEKKLASLYRKAQGSEPDRIKFSAAIKAFQDKGWTYRTLGAAIGVSHELVRLYASKGENDNVNFEDLDMGFEVPERVRPLKTLPVKDLPEEIASDLKARLENAINSPLDSREGGNVKPAVAEFFAALAAAEKAGWDGHSTGKAIGVHPLAVGKFILHHNKFGADVKEPKYAKAPVDKTPRAWNARHEPVPPMEIPASEAESARDLQVIAKLNRGVDIESEEVSALEAAKEYSNLLGSWYLRGASRDALEEATGQHWNALRKRLSRWGYLTNPPPGTVTKRNPKPKVAVNA
jgi:hypothetical protein